MAVLKKNENSHSLSLHLYLLGASRIEVNGQVIELRRKPKRLIKLLALQPNHRLHSEQIIELLWSDQKSEAAINNLHKAVHAARRALEPSLQMVNYSHFISSKEGQMFESQAILQAVGELDAVIREDDVDAVRHGSYQPAEKLARGVTSLVRMQFSAREL